MGVSVVSPVFIGRQEEMTALASALQRVRASRSVRSVMCLT